MKHVLVLMAFFVTGIVKSIAQPGVTEATYAAITASLQAIYGQAASVGQVINVDSSRNPLGDVNVARGAQDSYGTLTGCYIFTGRPYGSNRSDGGVVGIFRNNAIVWQSDTLMQINDSFGQDGEIYGVYDLNRDGRVDIITMWRDTRGGRMLQIVDWDGTSGRLISENGMSENPIMTDKYGVFDFVDIEGDGVWEVQGSVSFVSVVIEEGEPTLNADSMKCNTHRWNGTKYTLWSGPQPPCAEGVFYPRNRLEASVSASLIRFSITTFRYDYTVRNKVNSAQALCEFHVETGNMDAPFTRGPGRWRSYESIGLRSWRSQGRYEAYPTGDHVSPGDSIVGLNVTYASLPRIGRYYACGYNGSRYDTNENDVVTNSFVGLTVVPRVLPSSFNALGFLDTIKSYITEGRTLGWIANDPTKNKYTRLIDSAKANLSSSPARRGTAKAKLDSVL
ncbi:hypothetical protein FBQ87_10640, partial [Sphingobacteriales bacterium CHB3]|nr:hypothetical protein [Sphingobacteriales bacterium CHB3]